MADDLGTMTETLNRLQLKLNGIVDRSFESTIEELRQAMRVGGMLDSGQIEQGLLDECIERYLYLAPGAYSAFNRNMAPSRLPSDFDLFQRTFGGATFRVREIGGLAIDGFGLHVAVYHNALQDPLEFGVVNLARFPYLPFASVGFPRSEIDNSWIRRSFILALDGSSHAGQVFSVSKVGRSEADDIETNGGLPPNAAFVAPAFSRFLDIAIATNGDFGLDSA